MKLTKHSDYAFRVLIYLAALENDQLATIKEITTAFDISRDHVMKIVQKLAKSGLINALRGKKGGIKLGRPTSDINLREVVTLMETSLLPVNCGEPICKISSGCQLAKILFDAQELFLSHLGQYSLDDITQPNSETVKLIRNVLISN